MNTATSPNLVTANISYSDLYARSEKASWRATEIDFSQDPADWKQMNEAQRRSALWLWSAVYSSEESVTDNITPYIDAMPREDQKYFLTTHQADEARHTVMFHRFFHEVVGSGDSQVSSTLAAADKYLNWGYRKVFGRLDVMAEELRRDHTLEKLAEAVTHYFIIGEASLGHPTQLSVFDYLSKYDILPGIREGFERVANDEHRHIAFGVKCLSDLYHEHGMPIQDA
ncbi:ribonucleotide-diphosphate reductase subunit beta, partial [Pseudomonas sp.]|uniref:ribonucleotide-diphosphate reductase subunit beta n=1 Tax=Pseudomonas sp. TaxID=306 RepID=UPI002608C7D6